MGAPSSRRDTSPFRNPSLHAQWVQSLRTRQDNHRRIGAGRAVERTASRLAERRHGAGAGATASPRLGRQRGGREDDTQEVARSRGGARRHSPGASIRPFSRPGTSPKDKKITHADRKAAAKRAARLGLKPGVAGLLAAPAGPIPGSEGPGGIPHYFGPYGNWAYSPLPSFGISSVTVDNPGTGYTAPVVTITDVYGTGTATAAATFDGTGAITAITVDTASSGFHVPFVTITDPTGTGRQPRRYSTSRTRWAE